MKMNIKCKPCPDCGKAQRVEVEEADFYAWQTDTLIQDAFPYLDADQRELLQTGYCKECWAKLWEDVDEYFPGYAPHEAVFLEAAFKYELEHWEELHPDD